ncbi:MAG: hypothetical protein WB783_05000 [Arenicellales bacterium]
MKRRHSKEDDTEAKTPRAHSPSLGLRVKTLQRGDLLLAHGRHWPIDAVAFRIGKKRLHPKRILRGNNWNGLVVPDGNGDFLAEFVTGGLEPGKYRLEAMTRDERILLKRKLVVEKRVWPGNDVPREKINKNLLRIDAFNERRFDPAQGLPAGAVDLGRIDWERIHGKSPQAHGGSIFFTAPVMGGCNWTPMGPAPFSEGKGSSFTDCSGRLCSIAVHPTAPSTIYVGTANGGVWKTIDNGLSWVPKTGDQFSLAIGAIAIDPVTPDTVYAGTGEYVPDSDCYYYGNGLLKTINGGISWTEIGTSYFSMADIARIAIDPMDTNHLYVAASNGIWESTNGGTGWNQLSVNPAAGVVLARNPAEPGTIRLIAGLSSLGIYSASNSGTGWSGFSPVTVPGAPTGAKRIALGACRSHPQHIYAAFSEPGSGNMLAHVARSTNYGADWTACTIPDSTLGRIYQASYNLAILPHPDDPETVLLAVVDIFKSINGGGSWANVASTIGTRVHADSHAIAFGSSDPDKVYIGCDGGFFYSPDLTASWEARNQDIASIQVYDIGQHPQYDAIMIAGSQDNGGFHYSGAPIWFRTWATYVTHNAMDGDAVVATIDPFNGMYHYYGTGPESSLARSDDAGRLFTTPFSIPTGSPWWTPFFPDPRTEGVLFIGGTTVVRSDDRGDTWSDVLTGLPATVRAMGFHPTDPLVVFMGTTGGQVYRLQGPPIGVWNTTTVTSTEVTYTGLPANKQISGVAVDPSENVWVSFSSLLEGEDPGEFSNQHVFRLEAGATAWVQKSDGLAIANPVNAIIIDPLDPSKVYCGADRGVYAWNAAGDDWAPFDQGLPNAAVMLLRIHGPSRMLRAGTFGRGVWERHLDPAACTDHFLYMRSHLADAGAEPAPDGVTHPYLPGYRCWHWQSPDIIVDPAMQTPSAVTNAMELYNRVQHYGGRRGSNRVYVTVHNKGPFTVTNVKVRVFFAMLSGGLPAFPAGLLANPFNWVPSGVSDWNPVGAAFSIGTIGPGTTRLAVWPSFTIPMSAPSHSCMMAFITSDEDPFSADGVTNPDALAIQNRKAALKNLDLDGPAYPDSASTLLAESGDGSGGGMPAPPGLTAMRKIMLNSTERDGAFYQPTIYAAHLPEDAVCIFAIDSESRKNILLPGHRDTRAEKKAARHFERIRGEFCDVEGLDPSNVIVRQAELHGFVSFGKIHVSKERPVEAALWIWSEKWDPEVDYEYDFIQRRGKSSGGGATVRFKGYR